MHKFKSIFIDLLVLFIITAPAFFRILNGQYFSMHDDQHIARLYLLDQGLRQGYLYPRWVDGLGFGFGYPLYNFYPPLIYFVGEFFHLLGFSLIWSIKLVFISGFYLGAWGTYLLTKRFTNRAAGLLSSTLYTFSFYHAVLIYVRGALAEFFSLSLLPFLFLSLDKLADEPTLKNAFKFSLVFALLILCHPLIALPSLMFLGFLFLFYLIYSRIRIKLTSVFVFAFVLGLGFSAFFWLPSIMERKFTLTDQILTGELANYKLHYIFPQQFIYSPWGFGGSVPGLSDGVSFQLGKIHIGLIVFSFILFIFYWIKKKDLNYSSNFYLVSIVFVLFSLFMTMAYSSFIWDKLKYLWYLQFPWRFLTFTTIFISLVGGYNLYFLEKLLVQLTLVKNTINPLRQSSSEASRLIVIFLCIVSIMVTIFVYQKYFRPQQYIYTNDRERTSFEEVSWRISRTSYEFVPKGVRTKKTDLNTTILDIDKEEVPKKSFAFDMDGITINEVKNQFYEKTYSLSSPVPFYFRLNTFDFPGWTAYLDNRKTAILNNNKLKLIVVNIPEGNHNLDFKFENTAIRKLANFISLASFSVFILLGLRQFKKVNT